MLNVAKYTSPMDGMGPGVVNKTYLHDAKTDWRSLHSFGLAIAYVKHEHVGEAIRMEPGGFS